MMQNFDIQRHEKILKSLIEYIDSKVIFDVIVKYFENEFEEITYNLMKKFRKNYKTAIVEYYMSSQGLFNNVSPTLWETNGAYVFNNIDFVYDMEKIESQHKISQLLKLSEKYIPDKKWKFYEDYVNDMEFFTIKQNLRNKITTGIELVKISIYEILETLQKFVEIAQKSNMHKTLIDNCDMLMEKFIKYEEVIFFVNSS